MRLNSAVPRVTVPARRGILQADGGGSTTSADGGEFRFIAQADETSPQQHHTDLVSSSGNVNGTSSPYSSEAAVELLLGVLKQQSSRDAVENARRRRIEEINNDILATLRKITSEVGAVTIYCPQTRRNASCLIRAGFQARL